MDAVKQFGLALNLVSEDPKRDRDIVTNEVKWEGQALKFASEDIQQDMDILASAVNQNGVGAQVNIKTYSERQGYFDG